jgi:L-ascorbate metabolism protein UlaG (beta-lactamase superfamily)
MLKPATKIGRKFQNPVPTTVTAPRNLLKILWAMATNKQESFPRTQLGPFRTDPNVYRRPPASGLRITWMGHSSSLIEIDGFCVLVDPVWDKRASPVSWAGPKRFYPAPLALEDLPALDAILISHDHYDHLGNSTVQTLAQLEQTKSARWVTSLGVGKFLRDHWVDEKRVVELDWTGSVRLTGRQPAEFRAIGGRGSKELTITALPTRHFSGRGLGNRFETLWSSFVLKGAEHNVYFGADSGMWDGFAEIAEEYGPFDLTMLDTGAYNKLWKHAHMGPDGAAEAFVAMGAPGLLMPIHWGLFNLALHAWRQPIERITELADRIELRLWSPEPGLPTEVIANREHRSDWWKPETDAEKKAQQQADLSHPRRRFTER